MSNGGLEERVAKSTSNELHGSENDTTLTSFTQLLTGPITIDMLTTDLF
jgi:hypothetical protein